MEICKTTLEQETALVTQHRVQIEKASNTHADKTPYAAKDRLARMCLVLNHKKEELMQLSGHVSHSHGSGSVSVRGSGSGSSGTAPQKRRLLDGASDASVMVDESGHGSDGSDGGASDKEEDSDHGSVHLPCIVWERTCLPMYQACVWKRVRVCVCDHCLCLCLVSSVCDWRGLVQEWLRRTK